MAGLRVVLRSGEQAVVAGTPKTILQLLTPGNQGAQLKEIVVTQVQAIGVAPTNETALVEVLVQNSISGNTTGVSTEKIDQARLESVQCSANVCTTEPTTNKRLFGEDINPAMGGAFVWKANNRADEIPMAGGQVVGVRVSPAYASGTRNYRAMFVYEE